MKKKETFNIHGSNLLSRIKELIEEGNITSIAINDKHGKELMNFSLTMGVVAAVIAPMLAAVGALALFIGECSLTIEREEPDAEEETK
ncbi:DUF4342 domain-containing protein [Mucilaginibacter phyllosphaerae]|uniref:DUF4342 domain-containing protein n=1 Tax=Mucilaginibacter phyllosphaerae TaxID=1812349 RepID=A0A4Y8ABJ1_9SPHI|nr:DUF4342 domain-containing protein [Mucilaginibacter phyllosphaerae]MBB3969350.1 hypothetical protein [Mucilaginibacter phyllosphaerae]TEW65860.1 DUF4342 domain-containing protein [Mucilaginibacter phyllosphaerae]